MLRFCFLAVSAIRKELRFQPLDGVTLQCAGRFLANVAHVLTHRKVASVMSQELADGVDIDTETDAP